ncbi:MAG: helix-turn-helix domain-containing protein [Methanomassiliicoccaceae archaeon]|jgi:transcriptional regulator with XRE-family HTH domain|nr:helix-turn-helix domain-containing protein [Methanomassiliicoccaceae archaeon]
MDARINDIAERIRALRDATGYSTEDMAKATGISNDEYSLLENGKEDFTFTFLYKCAEKFGVDIVDILTGENPHLSEYTVVRKGKGLPMKRREGFEYDHLAYSFKRKKAEPFLVNAPYRADEVKRTPMSSHDGQEFNYVLKGRMRFVYDDHVEELNEGDSVYYDSSKRHGMAALDKGGCVFLAIVLKEDRR